MRKFAIHTVLFAFLAFAFIEVTCALLLHSQVYLFNYPGYIIYNAILKSKNKSNQQTLLLGDSVGHQLFPNKNENDSVNSLACNQAISLAGQYILLQNYINTGSEFENLVLYLTPFSFRNNLDQEYTYHYFLKPFDNGEYRMWFTSTVKAQIAKIPFHQFHNMPHIAATSWAPDFESKDTINFTFLSPISIEYLHKIKALAEDYDFNLKIVSPPININKQELVDALDQSEIEKAGLEEEFTNYFNSISYLDSTLFSDGTHFKDPESLNAKYRNRAIE